MVLLDREGYRPEVGELIDDNTVELINGKRVKILEGDYVDPIDRSVEKWSKKDLIILNKGLKNRTFRRMRKIKFSSQPSNRSRDSI